jgi:hypothetical protein
MMKGENQIFKILRDSCIKCLNEMGITDDFDVRRFAQANVAHGNRLILLNMIGSQRVGWQAHNYKYSASLGKEFREDEWLDQQSWQFSFIKKMTNNDTVDTISADDMCNFMITWFNGVGNLDLREKGIANLIIDPHSVIVYNDDSDLYQRRPVFTMEVQIPKSFKWVVPDLSAMDVETYPI